MAALGQLGAWRHGVVAAAALGTSALAYTGVIGGGQHAEKFEAKQVLVTPAGADGLRIREVVDEDFGSFDRHGYQRIIPNDFGVPTDVEATSPDASAQLSVGPYADDTRIRIGDPNKTIDGQHRYVLSYTLPEARLSSGQLALDIIGTDDELKTDRFEVVVAGFELTNPLCNVGSLGTSGGCELQRDGDVYRAVISPLEPYQGITIGGTITSVTTPVDVAAPPVPARRSDNHLPLAVALLALGALGGGGVFAWARRKGRNEIAAGGAADAAYGGQATPFAPPGSPPPERRFVSDAEMARLATTEFVPPKGIAPWQGAVLLNEKIDDRSLQAWFSGMAATGVIDLERNGDEVTMSKGSRYDSAPDVERQLLDGVFGRRDAVTLGGYNRTFAEAWRDVRVKETRAIANSGWWLSRPPRSAASGLGGGFVLIAVLWVMIAGGSALTAAVGVVRSAPAALAFGLVVPALAAFAMYRSLLPARSAAGSALALRTESFRRFLAASEGQHVEWAWKNNLLREYSAWAVALGAADAWQRALAASGVPPAEYLGGPMVMYYAAPVFSHAITPPQSSGGSGGGGFGGGFSGGSVGGGGGGGSSGSW